MIANIVVTVEGREHEGKTSFIADLAQFCEERGYNYTVARMDPQFEEKLADPEKRAERLTGENAPTIHIREVNTGPKK